MLALIETRWPNLPLRILDNAHMAELIDKWRSEMAGKPRKADEMIRVLRGLIRFARKHGWLTRDVTVGFNQFGAEGREEIFWTEADIDAFVREAEAEADYRPEVGDAVQLIAATGLGLKHALALRWSDIEQFTVRKPNSETKKRSKLALLPGSERLFDKLWTRKRQDGVDNVLVDSFGNPWCRATLAKYVKIYRERADIWHLDDDTGAKRAKHFNDLRKTYTRRLLASGASKDEICTLMNWRMPAADALRSADEVRNGLSWDGTPDPSLRLPAPGQRRFSISKF
jgi:integrase